MVEFVIVTVDAGVFVTRSRRGTAVRSPARVGASKSKVTATVGDWIVTPTFGVVIGAVTVGLVIVPATAEVVGIVTANVGLVMVPETVTS
jgi:hypothetical protein